jgi:asparagine synthase (glutamine-hydrolysing)
MCGITGWLDARPGRGDDQTVIRRMVQTMACRGPDAGGCWVEGDVALGHRRLSVIDLEGGAQPMVASTDAGPVVIVYCGEVYNFARLRRLLVGRGHGFGTRSDTEVILRAYLEWGDDVARHLDGMFAFAIWDGRRRELLLVRDRLGVKPLFYAPAGWGVLFASEPKGILAHPSFEPVVDRDGLRDLVSFVSAPGSSIWRRMREVEPGTLVTFRQDGACERRPYWRLSANRHCEAAEESVRHVRHLLSEIVRDQLVADVPLSILLSGGLDSSALAAMARAGLGDGGSNELRSFALDFRGDDGRFRPDEQRDARDLPFARRVAEHCRTRHEDVVLTGSDVVDAGLLATMTRAYDRPVPQGDLDSSYYLLCRAVRERSTVALTGEAADEVFGGYRWFHDEAAIDTPGFPWFPWHGASRRLPRFSVLRAELEEELGTEEYRRVRYEEAVAEVPRLDGETGGDARMRELTYLHLTRLLPSLLDRVDRMSMAVGLEIRVPYCDHRLVQYLYDAPWALKTLGGREKGLLRAAVAPMLPAAVLERRKSHYPSVLDPRYDEMLRTQCAELCGRPGARAFDLVDREKVAWLVSAVRHPSAAAWARRSRELVLSLDHWLELYRPRLV